MMQSNLYGTYRYKKFTDFFPSIDEFNELLEDNTWANVLSTSSNTALYYLLYAQYGNSTIANADENQFKYKLLSVIYSFGPSWEKKLNIQKTLRSLTEDELILGSKAIYNHSYNPSTTPSTSSLEELETINEQNTQNLKRSKLDAYGSLYSLITNDVTTEFIRKFRPLFLQVVAPERPLLYETEE